MAKNDDLYFDVSKGLKTVLGRELITNDVVAIFEMVKNSFDAGASNVVLFFDETRIVVADNGSGMSLPEIKSRWLKVAFSQKKLLQKNFRDGSTKSRKLAGSKGVGRFSSDRLGNNILLQTRVKSGGNTVHSLRINWSLFEEDEAERFESVPLNHQVNDEFSVPRELKSFAQKLKHGTIMEVSDLRHEWNRADLQDLKSSLSKLINPYGSEVDKFSIEIIAPSELAQDKEVKAKAKATEDTIPDREIINGRIGNFIFEVLREKTTYLSVLLQDDYLQSTLVDRGETVYQIRELNPYKLLNGSRFRSELFYLNQSAKITFAKRVGIPSIQFGSVFLFRNGFRVYPVGDDGDDWFGFNRRKQQGYSRFLGSRELMGRVDVIAEAGNFEESSSRNQALIDTPAVRELKRCVMDHCIKRLEKYVVPVSWVDKGESNSDNLSRLETDPGKSRVTASIAELVDNDEIELIAYSRRLIGLLNERSENFERSLIDLKVIAEKTEDKRLLESIVNAEHRFEELKKAGEEARKIADRERSVALKATERAERAESVAETESRRSHFLQGVASVETKQLLNIQHQITLYSSQVSQLVENLLAETQKQKAIPREQVLSTLEKIVFFNRRIQAFSRVLSTANFRMDSGEVNVDLASYLTEYIENVARISGSARTKIIVKNDHPGFKLKFKPDEAAIIVDNMVSNAKKMNARKIEFALSQPDKSSLQIDIVDNGDGLSRGADADRIFEMGYSTTDGSGLGLYHVRQVLGGLNGTIELAEGRTERGLAFKIDISRGTKRNET
jgi:signal transduction histidine kinase